MFIEGAPQAGAAGAGTVGFSVQAAQQESLARGSGTKEKLGFYTCDVRQDDCSKKTRALHGR